MRVANEVYKEIKMDWDNITFPLKEGSPVSLNGVVSNDGDAIGLVPQTITKEPLIKSIWILVGGDVDLAEVEEAFGDSLEDAAKSNMNGLRFWLEDGTVYNATELPSVTADDNGDVLTVVEGEWAKATPSGGGGSLVIGVTSADDVDTFNKTWKEIHDAMASGQIAMILSEEDAYTVFQNSIAYITKDKGGNKPYRVIWLSGGDEVVFYATTENDYPSSDNGEGGGE